MRVLFVWEFGRGLGHVGQILPVAHAFFERGHDVYCVFQDSLSVIELPFAKGLKFLQAPTWPAHQNKLGNKESSTIAEIFIALGMEDSNRVRRAVLMWRTLYSTLRPSLIVADYAPLALVAARTTGIPTAIIGAGFYLPPKLNPIPSLRPWMNLNDAHAIELETRVKDSLNSALLKFKAEPLQNLSDLFHPGNRFLTTYRELDHFHARRSEQYIGSVYGLGIVQQNARWSRSRKQKCFLYVNHPGAYLSALHEALESNDCESLTTSGLHSLNGPQGLVVSNALYDFELIAKEVDFVICHGGHGSTSAFLRCGRPVLLVPTHLEQLLLARRVVESGLGLMIGTQASRAEVVDAVLRLQTDRSLRERCEMFAGANVALSPCNVVEDIVDALECFTIS